MKKSTPKAKHNSKSSKAKKPKAKTVAPTHGMSKKDKFKLGVMAVAVLAIVLIGFASMRTSDRGTQDERNADAELKAEAVIAEAAATGEVAGQALKLLSTTRVSYVSCKETDSGKDPENYGQTTVVFIGPKGKQTKTYQDTCLKGQQKEYYCSGNRHAYSMKTCKCENGICAAEEAPPEPPAQPVAPPAQQEQTVETQTQTITAEYTPNCQQEPTLCDDGLECTVDTCGPTGCVHVPTHSICNDGNVCTTDSCHPQAGCMNTPNLDSCDDGNACTTGDRCNAGTCSESYPLDCNDGNPCTTDACNPALGCGHVEIANCGAGDENKTESCGPGNYYPYGDTRYCLPCPPSATCAGGHSQPEFS